MATNPPSPPTHQHIPALDGVRGLAVILIIVHHIVGSLEHEFAWRHPLLTLAEIGWVGVDLFFVLSGFLITGILLEAKNKRHYFRNFYARRTLRIFPLYYLALAVVLLMSYTWPDADFYPEVSQAWLWTYATNIIVALEGFGTFGTLEHFWSLAVEEHFYLMWPAIVLGFSNAKLLRIAAATWVAALTIRVAMVLLGAPSAAPYVFTFARIDTLAAGAFVAIAARERGSITALRSWAPWVWGFGATAFIAVVLVRKSFSNTDLGIATLGSSALAAVFTGTLILAMTQPLLRGVFEKSILRAFGKYSYGLYVWHPIVFIIVMHSEVAKRLRGGDGVPQALVSVLVAFLLTGIVTAVSWHLYEKQFLKLKHRFPSAGDDPPPTVSSRVPAQSSATPALLGHT